MLTIYSTIQNNHSFPLFNLGFRPFFLGAASFAVLTVALWIYPYIFAGLAVKFSGINPVLWHAHEMVFGYSAAVIAGFLLTAVKNWTGIQTICGPRLALLFMLWFLARLLALFGEQQTIYLLALADILFSVYLTIALLYPILRVKQWKQIEILSKVILLSGGNILFYLGLFGYVENGMHWGLYSGFYSVIGLILALAKRIFPFFIERGVDYQVKFTNREWLDQFGMVLFTVFFLADVFTNYELLTACLALVLFVVYGIRMWFWHTPGLWRKPLLWSLYCAYGFIVFGFLLHAANHWLHIHPYLAIHAFAFGGIGLTTLSIMSRVSLGHTGRNVHEPPKILSRMFVIFLAGAVFRIIIPLIDMGHYTFWITLSGATWIASFCIFLWIYSPMLVTARSDGKSG